MAKKKKKDRKISSSGVVATNRKARHDYTILETYEAGIQLVGTEVKSLRTGKSALGEAFATVDNNEIWLRKLAARWGASVPDTFRALRDNFCANLEGGAWILRQGLDEARGDFWQGVGYYHSHAPEHKANYLRKVLQQALRLEAQAGRAVPAAAAANPVAQAPAAPSPAAPLTLAAKD